MAKGAGVRTVSLVQKALKLKADLKYLPWGWTEVQVSVRTRPDPEPPTGWTARQLLWHWTTEPEVLF